ncbi:uncharacterized protein LOC125054051 [Pieris napi]|uniref:uncharacterized protein LOC125054051 n=1 Tax=Pieris napi TaxID=78633 RepID=UPI001FB99EDF|nr:uncharacterized protein LOC125054051 [Pieris napi]
MEMDKIKQLSKLSDNPRDICIFSSNIVNIVTVIKALKKEYYLFNPESVRAVVEKMTPTLRYRWYDYAAGRPEEEADLVKLSSFFSREADLCSRYAQVENVNHSSSQRRPFVTNVASTTVTSRTSITPKKQSCECTVCHNLHHIKDCKQLMDLQSKCRWEKAKDLNLCFRCLGRRNHRHRCSYEPCGIGGCKASHHSLLHFSASPSETPVEPAGKSAVVAATRQKVGRALLKIVPVRLRGPKGTMTTFALLDEGSSVTLIEKKVASEIGLTGPEESFIIEGVAGARTEASSSRRVSLYINGVHTDKEHKIEARTIDSLNLNHQSVDADMIEGCDHLLEITEDLTYDRGTPTLLIGQDNWHLIISRKIRSGGCRDPVASLTELGWVLHGPTKGTGKVSVLKLVNHSEEEDEKNENKLEDLFKQFLSIDSLGIEPKRPKNDPEERALSLLKSYSHRLPDGRFESGLLWRKEELELPENRENALRRLIAIEKKLDKNPKQKMEYNAQIEYLLECGYAEEALPSSRSGRTWYLPHFAVINPSKPKPRIILDAAAKTNGISLNDMLLTGPDLLQSLPGVLMRMTKTNCCVRRYS